MTIAQPQAEPTHEEKLQQQLAEQLQLPGLDTSAPQRPQPALQHAKVRPLHSCKSISNKIIQVYLATIFAYQFKSIELDVILQVNE